MCFSIEDPFIESDMVDVIEKKVQVFQRLSEEPAASIYS
jgi:hypothetical protein